MNEIPLALINDFKKNNVVLFVGAGASINSGLPSWERLLDSLGKRFLSLSDKRFEFYESCDYLEKAQYLYDLSEKVTVLNEVKDIFSSSISNIDLDIQNRITSLPIDTVITTNWDNLVENSFETRGISFNKIWKDDQISSTSFHGKNIIKLHGTLEDPDSIVFSEDDYNHSFNKNPLLEKYLSAVLSRSTILMIGYSYSDINFKVVSGFVNKCLGSNSKRIYTLQLNPNDERVNYLEKRGLRCINFTSDSFKNAITDFFEKLQSSVSVYADNSVDRLKITYRENSEILHRYNDVTLRNMAALGPLATPLEINDKSLFGINTELEISCAKNWISILEKTNSRAKIILCLNEVKAKAVFSKQGYIHRIETLINNLEKYKDKIEVIDSGSPLIMSNFDIYGDFVFLENIKTNVNKLGYGYMKLHRMPSEVKSSIEVFDRMFDSIRNENLTAASEIYCSDIDDEQKLRFLIQSRLETLLKRVKEEW